MDDKIKWPKGIEPTGSEVSDGFEKEEAGVTGLPQSLEKKLNGMKERLKNPRESTGTSATYHGKQDLSLPTEILSCSEALSDGAKLLWMQILYYSDKDDRPASPYFPAIETIAKRMGKSRASVHKLLNELKEAGLVTSIRIQVKGELRVRNHYDMPDITKWWKAKGRFLKKENKEKKDNRYKNLKRYQDKKREKEEAKNAETRIST